MLDVALSKAQLKAITELDSGKILCGDVGSGKSRTALAYFVLQEGFGGLRVNGSGNFSWMKNPVDVYVITTAMKRDTAEWFKEAALFGITTNQEDREDGVSIQVDSWNNISKYVGVKNAFFIFDEQRLVGSGAWVKSFLKIAKENRWILLSATPGDRWIDYIPVFVANGFVKNRTQFKDDHVIYQPHSQFPKIVGYRGEVRLKAWREKILVKMPMVRHTTRHDVSIISDYDRDAFDLVLKKRWNVFEDRPIENVPQLFHAMRRVVNSHPDRYYEILKIHKKHKRLIVFYSFDYELDILRELYKETDVAERNGHRHDPLPKSDEWIYLVQYTSGSEGWNCITADAIALYSLQYSWRTMEQAKGRIDRMNTGYSDLYYYTIRSTSKIDVAILKTLRAKENFNENRFIDRLDPGDREYWVRDRKTPEQDSQEDMAA